MRQHTVFAEKAVAEAGRLTPRAATKVLERGEVLEQVPPLATAMQRGAVSAAHVDAVGAALRQLEPEQREAFAATVGGLLPVAESGTPDELERRLKAEIRRLQTDDGMAK